MDPMAPYGVLPTARDDLDSATYQSVPVSPLSSVHTHVPASKNPAPTNMMWRPY